MSAAGPTTAAEGRRVVVDRLTTMEYTLIIECGRNMRSVGYAPFCPSWGCCVAGPGVQGVVVSFGIYSGCLGALMRVAFRVVGSRPCSLRLREEIIMFPTTMNRPSTSTQEVELAPGPYVSDRVVYEPLPGAPPLRYASVASGSGRVAQMVERYDCRPIRHRRAPIPSSSVSRLHRLGRSHERDE